MNEWDLIRNFKRQIPRKLQGELGIGDDADVLKLPSSSLVCTTDVIVEDVDFRLSQAKPQQIGHKALAVNLSDLAAMGAKPLGYLVSLGLSPKVDSKWVAKMYQGLLRLSNEYGIKCLGGDLSKADQVFVSITALGIPYAKKVITRAGARPGDLIAVTGSLGGSILRHHLEFSPRLKESEFLVRNFHLTAMIDISDGFTQDLEHILKASSVSCEINLEKIPVSRDASRSLQRALSDGEDFELLFTLPRREKEKLDRLWKKRFPKVRLSWVGEIKKGTPKILNLRLSQKGYTHFS
ncbi:MAG: thiamine-monophosphate kinase [Candidatus Omnitrophica bacterium]|nr:thiamine-monophosphate kinase [Candidatus Omnitrophota bacterium]